MLVCQEDIIQFVLCLLYEFEFSYRTITSLQMRCLSSCALPQYSTLNYVSLMHMLPAILQLGHSGDDTYTLVHSNARC
jgi:hypothetical protein